MAGNIPVYEMNPPGGTPMHHGDSGYLTSTPDSVESLDSGPWSNKKLLQRCKCESRNFASSTPDTMLLYTPELCYRRAHVSLCHKRKLSLRRFKLLQSPASSLSTKNGVHEPPFTNSESPLQSKCDNDLNELSLANNSFDSQEIGRIYDSDEMEVDENKSMWKAGSKEENTEQISGISEKSIYHHLMHMPTPQEDSGIFHQCSEIINQDSGIGSQESITKKGDLHREDCNLITDRLTKLTRRNILQYPLKTCQSSQESTPCSIPYCLKYSSWRRLCYIGQKKVDFLSLLGEKSDHSLVVEAILSYLDPVDLTAIAIVSKTWNRVCKSNRDACRRIQCYYEQKQKNKENRILLQVNKLDLAAAPNHHRIHLRQIENVGNGGSQVALNPPSPPPSPSKRRFLQFYKAAQKLENGQKLAPCPRCSLPSQIDGVSNVGQCTHERCQYLFCCICHCESHIGSSCPVSVSFSRSRKRIGTIGSKSSKKYLRRL